MRQMWGLGVTEQQMWLLASGKCLGSSPRAREFQHKQRLEVVWDWTGAVECYKEWKTLPGALRLPLHQAWNQWGTVSPKGMEGGTRYRALVALSLPGSSQAQGDSSPRQSGNYTAAGTPLFGGLISLMGL